MLGHQVNDSFQTHRKIVELSYHVKHNILTFVHLKINITTSSNNTNRHFMNSGYDTVRILYIIMSLSYVIDQSSDMTICLQNDF